MNVNFDVDALTFFETAEDGGTIRMHMTNTRGQPMSLTVPLACVISLAMTLPAMVTAAVQRHYGDDSKRVTYPLDRFRLELDADAATRILTLSTSGGFAVSFSLSEAQCAAIAACLEPSPAGTFEAHGPLN